MGLSWGKVLLPQGLGSRHGGEDAASCTVEALEVPATLTWGGCCSCPSAKGKFPGEQ